MVIRNRSAAWLKLDALAYQLIPIKQKYKISADETNDLAVEITAMLFVMWRTAQHPDITKDFYKEVSSLPGKTIFAKLCTYYLNITKLEFTRNGVLQRNHMHMSGVLDLLDSVWDTVNEPNKDEIVQYIVDRGGLSHMYMAWMSKKNKEASAAKDAEIKAEIDRREAEKQIERDKVELAALRLGLTVDQYVANQTIVSEKEKERIFLERTKQVVDQLVSNGKTANKLKGEDTFYIFRNKQLVKLTQSDVYDLLACKAKLARPQSL